MSSDDRVDKLPDRRRQGVTDFVEVVKKRHSLVCIILYGSIAKGTYTLSSDIDLVVLDDSLPDDFWERLYIFNELRPRGVPLQVLAYTPAEFERMLKEYNITALDAVSQGISLYGQEYFNQLQGILNELKRQGLRRTPTAWKW